MYRREFEFAEVDVSAKELDLPAVVEVEERESVTTFLFCVKEGEGEQIEFRKSM